METSTSKASSQTRRATADGSSIKRQRSSAGSARPSKAELEALYYDLTKSVVQVRRALNISSSQLYDLLAEYNLRTRKRSPAATLANREWLANEIIADWQRGDSRRVIANRHGVSVSLVYTLTRPAVIKRFSWWQRLIRWFKK